MTTYRIAKLSAETFDAVQGTARWAGHAATVGETFEDRPIQRTDSKGETVDAIELASVRASNRVLGMARSHAKARGYAQLHRELMAMTPKTLRNITDSNGFAACRVDDAVFVIVRDGESVDVKTANRTAIKNAKVAIAYRAEVAPTVKSLNAGAAKLRKLELEAVAS